MNNSQEQKKPLISFILPNYNNQHVIDLFFEKFIKNNTYDNYEFIVADDGSEDDGLEKLYSWQKSGKIKNMKIIAEPHKGIVNALNMCLYSVKGDFIIRMDGDATIETEGFVEKFLEFYRINPEKIGVITAKVISDTGWLHAIGRDVISEKGLLDRGKNPKERIGKRKWDWESYIIENIDKIINVPAECDTALGICTFCDTKTAKQIGGFDKNYPLWVEDDDFYLSFRLNNKKCFYLPTIEVCHRFSLRGDRNPDTWKKNKGLKNKFLRFIFHKNIKEEQTQYYFFNLPIIKTARGNKRLKIILLEIPILNIKVDTDSDWRPRILKHNYQYWEEKWGFNPLNPDMDSVKEKYKGTEILWNYDETLKQLGLDILSAYSAKGNVL